MTIDLMTLNGCRKFFVARSNLAPTLSILYDHPFLSYDVHTLTAIGNTNSLLAIAHAQYHVTYLQGVDINHILEIRDPYLSIHFATFMALRCRLISVIHKNSVLPMLKAKKLTAHVPYHVTYR